MTIMDKFFKILDSLLMDQERSSRELWQENLKSVNFQEGDVVVVGCLKTGTTWMQQILHQIRTRGDEDFGDIYRATKYLPPCFKLQSSLEYLNAPQVSKPAIFKCHQCRPYAPQNRGLKYVIIHRDPRDALWSYAKFAGRFMVGLDEDISKQDLLSLLRNLLLCDEKGYMNFGKFIVSWWPLRNDPNVAWIHYEDLKRELPASIRKLASFIDVSLTETELKKILRFCSFEYMSANRYMFQGAEDLEMYKKNNSDITGEEWKPKVTLVRPSGGQIGQGSQIDPEVAQFLNEHFWKNTVEKELGFATYDEFREATSFLA